MHSYHNKLLPHHFHEYFVPLSSIHYHSTRLATSKNLFSPSVNSSSGKCYLKFVGPKVLSCTRLRILLNTICRKPGFNSLGTPLNHGAEQASNETLKQTQQRNWSNASQGGQTALKEHFAVLHYETASTTQQRRGEQRGTIKDCKTAGATTLQGQGNHAFTTILPGKFRVRYDKR